MWLIVALVAAVVVRFVKRPHLVLPLLAIGAIPGLYVLWVRADAPLKRGASAEAISTTLGSMQALVPWPQSQVSVVRENDVLFPLARYALPSRGTGPMELELRDGPLGPTCRSEGQRVVCGAGP